MKTRFPWLFWIRSSAVFSCLCFSAPLSAADSMVSQFGLDDGSPGTLSYAMGQLGTGGGRVIFDAGLTGQTIRLVSSLPLINISSGYTALINPAATGPFVTIDCHRHGQGFFILQGVAHISNMNVINAVSRGGPGGDGGNYALYTSAGGGGGLGAGAGVFVNTGATGVLTNVTFSSNSALGGRGGYGVGNLAFNYGAGGGGAAFFSAGGGVGGLGEMIPSPGVGGMGGGGGGGGGGTSSGGAGIGTLTPGVGGTGGPGGGLFGGVGGRAGSMSAFASSGQAGGGLFSGGGGGGGAGGVLASQSRYSGGGGAGSDFAGGGGAGALEFSLPVFFQGGGGGFGGGGGGGAIYMLGGMGGYGGGGGGGSLNGTSSPMSSVFAGGTGGSDMSGEFGGGGGAGLGGALFVRQGGDLVVRYTIPEVGTTAISGNTAVGGVGGGGIPSEAGLGLGPDLFLASGGSLKLFLTTPLIISSAIDSDPLNPGTTLIDIDGSSTLALLGQNTFDAEVVVHNGMQLAVQSGSNLGLTSASLVLNGSVLQILSPGFASYQNIFIGDNGGVLSVTAGATALFAGNIAPYPPSPLQNGGVSIADGGTAIFAGVNTYGGTTTIESACSLQIQSMPSLPSGGNVVLQNGMLDFIAGSGAVSSNIVGTGTVAVESGAFPQLSGVNTYAGNTYIAPGGTLGIVTSTALSPSSLLTDDGAVDFLNNSGTISPELIQGSGVVAMDGSGILYLSPSDTYLGGTIFDKGVVQISDSAALGPGPLTFNGGTLELFSPFNGILGATVTLKKNGGTIQLDGGIGVTATGNWNGNGGITCSGTGQLILSGTSTYGGTTTIGPKVVLSIPTNYNALSPNSPIVDQGLLQLGFPSGTVGNFISGPGSVEIEGNVTYQNAKTYSGTTTIDPGAILIIGATVACPQVSPFVDNGLLDFKFPLSNNAVVLNGPITGSGALTVEKGSVTLNGINTYQGLTTILTDDGTLIIGTAGAFPPGGAVTDQGHLIFQNTSGEVRPGPIVGAGDVTMNGLGGSVMLTGTDAYSGGTIFTNGTVKIHATSALGSGPLTFNGGELRFLNPFSGILNLPSTLIFPGGGVMHVDSGVSVLDIASINGFGPFACIGSGTLILSATNNYMNTTFVGPSATLELTSLASLPFASVVTDNGDLVFSLTAPLSAIQNTIKGSGMVTLTGPNDFTLHAPNTYGGGTLLSTGTLQVSDFSALGSGPVLLQGGGTFEVVSGTHTNAESFILIPGGGRILLDVGSIFSCSGTILGTGPLAIQGPGAMTYSGTGTLSGTTTIGNGSVGDGNLTLQNAVLPGPVVVNTGANLSGYGVVGSLTNFGTLTIPSSHVLVVDGNFSQDPAALFNMTVHGDGSCSQMIVTQTANLDGTLNVTIAPGVYTFGTEFKVLTTGNYLGSQFSNIQFNPSSPSLLTPIYDNYDLFLVVWTNSVLDSAHVHGHNPQQVLANLQEIVPHPTLDLISVIVALGTLSSSKLTEALDQFHPAPMGAFDLLNAKTNSQLTSILSRHSAESCCSHLNQNCGCTETSLWVHPFGYLYDQERIGEQIGFHSNAQGLVGGFNFCSTSGLLMGAAGAYTSSAVNWNHQRGHGSMDKTSMALYGDYSEGRFSLETSVIGGLDVFTAYRHIHFDSIDRYAKHQKGGYDLTGHFGCGRDVPLDFLFFRPFLNLDYLCLYQKAFTENGAKSLDLKVQGRHSSMLRSQVGLSVTSSFRMGARGCFAPLIYISGINECEMSKQHYQAHFVDEIIDFEVRTFNKPIYLISPGVDLSFMFGCGLSASLRYSAELNGFITSQKMDGRLEWFF